MEARYPLMACLLLTVSNTTAQVGLLYDFSQNTGTYTPITGGTVLGAQTGGSGDAALDNLVFTAVPIGFPFRYETATRMEVSVSTNGFITFGATPPSATSYVPISSTTPYDGAVSGFGRRLEGGYLFTGDRASGSSLITGVTQMAGLTAGLTISGTGIPDGTTIRALYGDTVELSAAATSMGMAATFTAWTGELRHETIGTAPDRVFVVQWKGFKPQGTMLASAHGVLLNFQVRLYEADNAIEVVYGRMLNGAALTDAAPQVGLRGPTNGFANGNVNNRLVLVAGPVDWAASEPGAANSSTCAYTANGDRRPPEGLTYRWESCSRIVPHAVFDGTLFTEGFEDWQDRCSTADVPAPYWFNFPVSGNASWRRDDQGTTAGWTNILSGAYTPPGTEGSHSARFHSNSAGGSGTAGSLDLYIDMSAASGTSELRFDHINGSGLSNDALTVWESADGGATFTQLGDSLKQSAGFTWEPVVRTITSTSPNTVVRFRAAKTGATDNNDIGVDNLRIMRTGTGIDDAAVQGPVRWMGQDGDGHWLRTDDAVVRDWEVLDAMGRVVPAGNGTAVSGRLRIGLDGQGSGTYVVRVLTDRGPATVRLVHLAH